MQAVASDHVIHGSNISLAGFTTGSSPNRNLADFFQVAIDPQGMALIAWADDSADFAGHTYAAHQVAGFNLNTGKSLRIKGTNAVTPSPSRAPQVFDFRHDARVSSPGPAMPDVDSPVRPDPAFGHSEGRRGEAEYRADAWRDRDRHVLMGSRGSALAARTSAATPAATLAAGVADSTRGGGTFTMGTCQP